MIVIGNPVINLESADIINLKKEYLSLEVKDKYEKFYRTKTGRRYHRDGCIWLGASKILVTKEYIKVHKMRPCKCCCPDLQDKAFISLKKVLEKR